MWARGVQGIGVRELVGRTVRGFVAHDMNTYAAALAFRALLALFPFTIFLLALLGALGQPEFFRWLIAQAQAALPGNAFRSVDEVVTEVRSESRGGLISFSIVLALWAASVGVRSLMTALNAAYGVRESRPAWQLYPLSILYTIGLAVMLIVAAGLMLIGPRFMQWLAGHVGLTAPVVALWTWLRWPAAVVLLLFAFAVIYYVAPSVAQPFVLITPGSILAVAVWVAASLGFSYYIATFGNFGATYGSLGGVVVLLLYFFISAAVLLFGAELNATIYHFVNERGEVGAGVAEPGPAKRQPG